MGDSFTSGTKLSKRRITACRAILLHTDLPTAPQAETNMDNAVMNCHKAFVSGFQHGNDGKKDLPPAPAGQAAFIDCSPRRVTHCVPVCLMLIVNTIQNSVTAKATLSDQGCNLGSVFCVMWIMGHTHKTEVWIVRDKPLSKATETNALTSSQEITPVVTLHTSEPTSKEAWLCEAPNSESGSELNLALETFPRKTGSSLINPIQVKTLKKVFCPNETGKTFAVHSTENTGLFATTGLLKKIWCALHSFTMEKATERAYAVTPASPPFPINFLHIQSRWPDIMNSCC